MRLKIHTKRVKDNFVHSYSCIVHIAWLCVKDLSKQWPRSIVQAHHQCILSAQASLYHFSRSIYVLIPHEKA